MGIQHMKESAAERWLGSDPGITGITAGPRASTRGERRLPIPTAAAAAAAATACGNGSKPHSTTTTTAAAAAAAATAAATAALARRIFYKSLTPHRQGALVLELERLARGRVERAVHKNTGDCRDRIPGHRNNMFLTVQK